MMLRRFWLVMVIALAFTASAQEPMSLDRFPQSALTLATSDARLHRFDVWIADNDARRTQG